MALLPISLLPAKIVKHCELLSSLFCGRKLTPTSGNDIADLVLEVQYQTTERLNVKIYPKFIAPTNSSWFILPSSIVPSPESDGSTTEDSSDLKLDWRYEIMRPCCPQLTLTLSQQRPQLPIQGQPCEHRRGAFFNVRPRYRV